MKEFDALFDIPIHVAFTGEKGDKGDSIKGDKGDKGDRGADGRDGKDGKDGRDGLKGEDGKDGQDGRDGKDGIDGIDGEHGKDGEDGRSAHQAWLDLGNEGDEQEFIDSLKGKDAQWVGNALTELKELEDVIITNPQDGDIILYKSSLNRWRSTSLPIKYILTEEDLGTPVDGVITWGDGRYVMAASVYTNNRILLETDADIELYSLSYFDAVLRYNGNETFFTGSPRRFTINRTLIIGADLADVPTNKPANWPTDTPINQLFNIDGSVLAQRATVLFDWAQFAAFDNMGVINGFNTIAMQTANWSTYGTGLTISDGFDLLISGGRISNVIDPGSSGGAALIIEGFVFLGAVNGMLFTLNGDESAIKLDPALIIVEAFGINNCPINTENGAKLLDATGLQKDNIRVQVSANGQAPDSITAGTASFRNNITSTAITAGTPIKIAGTTTAGFLERIAHTTNRLTYIGVEEVTLRIFVDIRLTFTADLQGDTITLYIVKNGVSASPVAIDTSTLNGVFNNPTSPYLRAEDLVGSVVTDDYFEAWIESDGNDDIIVESLLLSVEKVGG